MRSLMLVCILIAGLVSTSSPGLALNPDEVLEDPKLEDRARALSVQIRCLVCQNQSIDDSDAELARDLRVLVREKLVEGLSDQEILDFLVARYGEFVLLSPPFSSRTLILWGTPFILLLAGGFTVLWFSRRSRKTTETVPLSESEKTALSRILEEK